MLPISSMTGSLMFPRYIQRHKNAFDMFFWAMELPLGHERISIMLTVAKQQKTVNKRHYLLPGNHGHLKIA